MSTRNREDLLAQLKVGDIAMYQDSVTGMYEVMSLSHPRDGDEYLELRLIPIGHTDRLGRNFEYYKGHFNREFTKIVSDPQQRELARLASLLVQANASGDVSEIHELLVKVEV